MQHGYCKTHEDLNPFDPAKDEGQCCVCRPIKTGESACTEIEKPPQRLEDDIEAWQAMMAARSKIVYAMENWEGPVPEFVKGQVDQALRELTCRLKKYDPKA